MKDQTAELLKAIRKIHIALREVPQSQQDEKWFAAQDAMTFLREFLATAPETAAISDVVWRIDNEAEQFVDEKGMTYLRYLRDKLLAAPSRPPPAGRR